jgi:uncharacterized membrane protein YkvA (DUF1232 family)
MGRLHMWAIGLRREILVLKLAAKDPNVPKRAKWLAAAAVGYALSPIDLIPDFIPVIGHLDDLVIVPGLAWLALRQIDPELLAELRKKAGRMAGTS